MKIEVQVQGEPDVKPFTKTFHYEKDDKDILVQTTQLIKKRLLKNLRLNINEVLGLFSAYIATSLEEHKTINEIQKHMPKLLAAHQVMIGVPESLRELTFKITTKDAETKQIDIAAPIHINQYIFHEESQIIQEREQSRRK